ncbi:MAG TPA: nucleotide exchange factor GrpE [Candidatus Nanoarchaeia archaeon]|nr:nucleotide exchange factor GrpE [Candidatus Nanoarchaeia archaeon]
MITETHNPQEEEKQNALPEEKSKEQEYLDQLQRLQAEFINYRSRVEKEKVEIMDTAKEQILIKFLDIKDNFERAPKLDEGMELIYKQFLTIFEEEGVQDIDTHGVFNPELNLAVGTNNDVEKNHIAAVLQKGYVRKNNVLRPSIVIVGSKEKTHDGM